MSSLSTSVDLVLVGGGLQNALVVLAVLAKHPNASVVLLERAEALLGNHTWCYHADDVPDEAASLIKSAIVARFDGYDVQFPDHSRTVFDAYTAISSDSLRVALEKALQAAPNALVLTSTSVARVAANHVTLEDGRVFEGRIVIDARGPENSPTRSCGYQKFVGLELQLSAPVTFERPLLMDACVEQLDGLRFVYVLPLSERRLLIEDTYFSDSPFLDVPRISRDIEQYAFRHGVRFDTIARTETGVLPLPFRSPAFQRRVPFTAGYAGGFFHPATGYSFPVAVRLALHVACHFEDPFSKHFEPWLRAHAVQFRFGTFLNRLLFKGFLPENRWNAMARFYRLPQDVIRRFYALNTTFADRTRIVCGRPPSGISLTNLLARGVAA